MPIQSVGSAISEGIVQGSQLGLQAVNQRERAEDRDMLLKQREQERQDKITAQNEANVDKSLARDRQLKLDERQAAQDARTQAKDELTVLNDELTQVNQGFTAAATNYGGFDNIPQQTKLELIKRQKDVDARLREARKKFANPKITADQKSAEEFFARVNAGQADFESLDAPTTYKHLTYMLKRPIEDFIRPDDKTPSRIEQAALDVRAGLDGGNNDLLLKGVNVLWATELSKGIGELRSDGSKIIKKEIAQLIPHPDDPSKFIPTVKVTVERQDGGRGVYEAPVTENRSSDPNDMPKIIDMDDAFEDMGRKETLVNILTGMRGKLEEGKKTAGPEVEPFLRDLNEEFVAAASTAGASKPVVKITRDKLDLGDRVIDRQTDPNGKIVAQTEYRKGAPPKAGSGSGDGESGVGITGPREKAMVEATASGLGVPVAKTQPGANLSPKERDKLLSKMRVSAEKRIETADEGLGDAKAAAEQAKRFMEILAREPAQQGVIMGQGPAITENARIMDEIRDFLTPRMRVPGSGATSDFDARMFQGATLGRTKSVAQNKAISQAMIARAELLEQKQQFMRDYLETNNHLEGAEREWKGYLNANPIFTKDSSPNDLKLNDTRQTYQEFFTGGGKPAETAPEGKPGQKPSGTSAAPAQSAGINVQSKTPPKEFRAKDRDALYDFQRAQETVQNNPSSKEEVRKRLISAGYPAAAVNAAIK